MTKKYFGKYFKCEDKRAVLQPTLPTTCRVLLCDLLLTGVDTCVCVGVGGLVRACAACFEQNTIYL